MRISGQLRTNHLNRRNWLFGVPFLALFLTVLGIVLGAQPLLAQEPPDDLACRGCHGDNTRELTLPSGETLPLLVPLDALDASMHGHGNSQDMSCTSCHIGRTRTGYRYPHPPLPAEIESLHDYRAMASDTCTQCHYPHRPFHDEEVEARLEAELMRLGEDADLTGLTMPTCVDCHGSHAVAPFEAMSEVMPGKCLECHTDQDPAWATEIFTPRAGFGEGAEGFAGSGRCLGCHEDNYVGWKETLHAQMIQDPSIDPSAIVGDFASEDPNLTFDLEEVLYTIGGHWKQRYLTQDQEGQFRILPAQWNVATQEWVPYHPEDWQEREWRQECSGCHVTGLDTTTWEFTEFSVGCESCHGPSLAHTQDPEAVKPYAQVDDQVCGACHSRGASPEGHNFPASYRPGDTLTDHFTFTTDEAHLWPDGSAKSSEQQYMDWQLGSPMALDPTTSCTSCHEVHGPGAAGAQLKLPLNDLCLQCHNDKRRIVEHMPYHEAASREHEFTCTDCHMPTMATSAVPFDIHNHSFLQPNPEGSIVHGGMDMMPNACNQCHNDFGEDPQWAVQTIEYAEVALAEPSFFGPGATPTSPPPPTPLPSVGEPVERITVEPGRWLRNTAFVVMGLMVVGALAGIVQWIRTRRRQNVSTD